MDPRVLLGQVEGAGWAGGERGVVPPRVLPHQIRQQAEVGLSWERVSEWLKEGRHLEHREGGRGRTQAPVSALAPIPVPIPAEVLARGTSVLLAV